MTRRLPPLLTERMAPGVERAVSSVRRSAAVRRVLRRRVLAGSVAALLAIGVVQTTGRATAERRRWGRTEQVLVATVDLPAGAAITARTTRVEQRPVPLLPEDALRELPAGVRATVAIGRGETVVESRLSGQDDNALAPRIPRGRSAVTVQLGGLQPNMAPGDLVDVLAPDTATPLDRPVPTETPTPPADPPASHTTAPARVLGAAVATVADDAVVLEVADDLVTLAVRDTQVRAAAVAALNGPVTIVVTG